MKGPSLRWASCNWGPPCTRPQRAQASVLPGRRVSILRIAVGSLSLLLLSAVTLQDMHLLAIEDRIRRIGDDGRLRVQAVDDLHCIAIVVSDGDGHQLGNVTIAGVLHRG